jgi:DNA-binding transcriptional LysR family regulator
MRITLAQLEAFFWVATLGSVQSAARQLRLAQPTVSLRLRDLEAVLGAELFERAGRGLRPTASGLGLIPRARAVLGEIERIREQSGDIDVSGTVRVGLAEGFAMVCLAPLVSALRRDWPALRPEFVVTTSASLERELIERQLDMAVLVNPLGHGSIRQIPLGIQPTSWMAAPSWGLGPKVRPADLRQVPIVTNPAPSAMFRQINGWFASAGIEPSRLDLCSSVTVCAHLVASGVVVGVLPHKMAERQLDEGLLSIVAADPPIEPGRVFVAYHEGGESKAIDAMIQSLRGVLAGMDYLVAG